VTGDQGVGESFLVDESAAGAIDDAGAFFSTWPGEGR
jgi:hypothetical protein